MLKSWGLGVLLVGLTLAGCGGGGPTSSGGSTSGGSTSDTPATPTPAVATVKQCLRAGGATEVSGRLLKAGEGQSFGIVKAQGPGGGEIQMALYETASEVQEALVLFSSKSQGKTLKGVGTALIVLSKPAAAEDRDLATQCARGS